MTTLDDQSTDDEWDELEEATESALQEPDNVFRSKTVVKFYEHENRIQYLEDLVEELKDQIIRLERRM